jgi:hypothetical protein
MDPRKLRVWARTARITAAAAAVFAIASCNLPQASPSGGESGDTGGQYESNQQALEGVSESDFKEYSTGCKVGAEWYLCITVDLRNGIFSDPPGEVTWKIKPGKDPCAKSVINRSTTSHFSKSSEIEISGKAEDDTKKCTFTGSSSVTVLGTGYCDGGKDWGVFTITVNTTLAEGPTTIECESKHPNGGKYPPIPIVLKGLELPTSEMRLQTWTSSNFASLQCKTFSVARYGEVRYCLYDFPSFELVPLLLTGNK